MAENLFTAFQKISDSEWLEIITKDLKGKSADEIAKDKIFENIDLKVFYSKSDRSEIEIPEIPNDWEIGISINSASGFNEIFQNAESSGIQSVNLHLDEIKPDELKKLDERIQWNVFYTGENDSSNLLDQNLNSNSCFYIDPIGRSARKGSWRNGKDSDLNGFVGELKLKSSKILIDSYLYGSAGASATTELSLTLAHLNEYLNLLRKDNQDLNGLKDKFHLRMSIGSDYFLEISKLRALRILLSNLLHAYGIKALSGFSICGVTNLMNFSSSDMNSNIIRATTSCMSAVVGGCNKVVVSNHDVFSDPDSQFGLRVAKNIQLLMKHEGHLEKVNDPSAGSYFVENLTHKLADKAWAEFQSLEAQGGLIAGIESGEIQKQIQATVEQRASRVKEKKDVLIGINKYTLEDAKIRKEGKDNSKTDFEPIRPIFLEDYC